MSLWAEIKRRNVAKVSIAYLALAWLVIQITDMAVPALNLPQSLNSIVFYIGMIGFPFAIFFAWAFEMTPDGIKKTESIDPENSETKITGKKLEHLIVGLLSIAVLVLMWEIYGRNSEPQITEVAEVAPIEDAPAELVDEMPSVAVLPFVNMSSDAEQEYFSDGISEEILNVLAKIPGLHVTSRSSAFAFKGQNLDLKQVADQLGVNHILEGSVRKAGDQVRITAQLIEANSDRHLWSETYDRELVDIFAVQDEISDAIVIVLKEKLMGEQETPIEQYDIAKTNPEAYTAYLQARQLFSTSGSRDEAFELLKKSVALDDNYAPSQALLAFMYRGRTASAFIPLAEGVPLARAHAQRAIDLDPNYEVGYVARARIKESFDFDFKGAREDLEYAVKLNPNASGVYNSLSMNSTAFGNFEQALKEARKSIELDPMNVYAKTREARVLTYMGDDENSLDIVDIARVVYPESQSLIMYKALLLINLGRFEEALELAKLQTDEAFGPMLNSMIYYGMGDAEESDRQIGYIIRDAADDSAYQIAMSYGYRSDIENCLKWLEIAYDQMDPGLEDVAVDRYFESVRSEPRYIALLEKMGLSPIE